MHNAGSSEDRESPRTGSSLITLSAAQPTSAPPSPDDVPTYIGPRRSPIAEALAIAPGTILGHFEILEAVGAGGMAAVLKARDTQLGRLVALKILPPDAANDTENIIRFKQEARAAALLDHTNIARVFFCGEDRGLHFIAFEYVEGQNLKQILENVGRITPDVAVHQLLQVAAGLDHAAERGVVHRDIKPSNIVISPDGRAKIVDMGLARAFDSHSVNGGVTQSGMTLGTFDYISPEQALDPRKADVRSDIYSLGCTYYHALTGIPPVPAGTAAAKLQAQQSEAPLDPRLLNPEIPDELAVILSRMMVKNPNRRYASPRELTSDLLAVVQQYGWQAPEVSAPAVPAKSLGMPREWPRLRASWVFAAVSLVLVMLAVVQFNSPATPDPSVLPEWTRSRPSPVGVFSLPEPARPVAPDRAQQPLMVENLQELLEGLQRENPHLILKSGKVFDLSGTKGVLVQSQSQVILECQNPLEPATIKLGLASAETRQATTARPETLTIARTGRVRFRGIRWELSDPTPEFQGNSPPDALYLADVNDVEFHECRVEVDSTVPTSDAIGIVIHRTSATPTNVSCSNSLFLFRQWTGWEILGRCKATFQHCAIAATRSIFRVGSSEVEGTSGSLNLETIQSSVLLENSAVVAQVGSRSRCTISTGYSLFAAPQAADSNTMMMMPEIRVPRASIAKVSANATDATVTLVSREGERTGFFRVDLPSGTSSVDLIELKTVPWNSASPMAKLSDSPTPWKAFQLNTSLRPLREGLPPAVAILGAQFVPQSETRIYEQWPPSRIASDVARTGVRIWWPNPPLEERDRLPRNVYENLSTALAEAKPGDDIEIRANGPVALPNTISLTRPNQRLVIKPEEGSKPILVPTLTDRIEMNLFRLEEGELRFENLEFLIRPVQIEEGDLRSATVVGFAGGRRCEFVSCVLTLDERFIEKLAVATVLESPGSIRKAETLRVPDLVMENCLIRGRGRGVLMPTAMPLNIKLTNTLIALQGSLLDLGAPSRTTPSGTAVAVTLQRVTTHIWGPIFRMSLGSSAESATWLPLEIRAEETLFVNPEDQTRPMILLRSPSEIPLERVVLWQTTGNAFANIPDSFSFLTVQRDDQEEPAQMKQPEWLKFSREKAASFGRVRFKSAPTTQVLTSIRASDFSTSERDLPPALQSTGANLATVASPTETKPSENN